MMSKPFKMALVSLNKRLKQMLQNDVFKKKAQLIDSYQKQNEEMIPQESENNFRPNEPIYEWNRKQFQIVQDFENSQGKKFRNIILLLEQNQLQSEIKSAKSLLKKLLEKDSKILVIIHNQTIKFADEKKRWQNTINEMLRQCGVEIDGESIIDFNMMPDKVNKLMDKLTDTLISQKKVMNIIQMVNNLCRDCNIHSSLRFKLEKDIHSNNKDPQQLQDYVEDYYKKEFIQQVKKIRKQIIQNKRHNQNYHSTSNITSGSHKAINIAEQQLFSKPLISEIQRNQSQKRVREQKNIIEINQQAFKKIKKNEYITQNSSNLSLNRQNHHIQAYSNKEMQIHPINVMQIENEKSQIGQKSQKNHFSQTNQSLHRQILLRSEHTKKAYKKHIILFYGKTGSGKSFTINVLHGRQIQIVVSQPNKRNPNTTSSYKVINPINGFQVGDNVNSLTEFINCIKMLNYDIQLIDIPGTSDTNGMIEDVANSISLEKLLHNSQSVRICFVIQDKSMYGPERGAGMVKLIQQFVELVAYQSIQQFIPTVTVLFTQLNHTSEQVTKRLKSILNAYQAGLIHYNKKFKSKIIQFLQSIILGSQINQIKEYIQDKKEQIQNIQQELKKFQYPQYNEKKKQRHKELQYKVHQNLNKKRQYQQKLNKLNAKKGLTSSIKSLFSNSQDPQITKLLNQISQCQKQIQLYSQQQQKLFSEKSNLFFQRQQITNIIKAKQQELKKLRSKNIPQFNDTINFTDEKIKNPQFSKLFNQLLAYSQKIDNPLQFFKISIKPQYGDKIQYNMAQTQKDIMKGISNNQYEKIPEKFEQSCYLAQNINQEKIKKRFQSTCQMLNGGVKEMQKKFAETVTKLCNADSNFQQSIFATLKQYTKNIENVQSFIEKIPQLDKEKYSLESFMSLIEKKSKQLQDITVDNFTKSHDLCKQQNNIKKLSQLSIQFPILAQSYNQFCKKIIQIIQDNVTNAQTKVNQQKYIQSIKQLTFLAQVKSYALEYFNKNIEQTYKQLQNNMSDSLSNGNQKILTLLQDIPHDKIEIIKNQLQRYQQLLQSKQLLKHIDENKLKNLHQNTTKKIQQIWFKEYKQIKQSRRRRSRRFISNNKERFLLLKKLRQVDKNIASKTADKYTYLIIDLEDRVLNKYKDKINQIIDNLKKLIIDEEDLQSIKTVFDILSNQKWLAQMFDSSKVKEIMDDAKSKLSESARQILKGVKSTFQRYLTSCQDNLTQTNDNSDDLSFSISNNKHKNNQPYTFNKLNMFQCDKLNQQISFVNSLSKIHQPISQTLNKLLEAIDKLINNQCQTYVRQVEINQKNLNESKIQQYIAKLLLMKQISIQNYSIDRPISQNVSLNNVMIQENPMIQDNAMIQENPINQIDSINQIDPINHIDSHDKVNATLSNMLSTIRIYLNNLESEIDNCQLNEHKNLKKSFDTLFQFIKCLNPLNSFLKKEKIDIEKIKRSVLQNIKNKINILSEKIKEHLSSKEYSQTEKLLNILKQYIDSPINIELLQYPYNQHRDLSGTLQKQNSQIPTYIQNIFTDGDSNFSQLLKYFNDRNSSIKNTKIKNQIKSKIIKLYQALQADITYVKNCHQPIIIQETLNRLNENIKKLISIKQLSQKVNQAIPQSNFTQIRKYIYDSINKLYQSKEQQIVRLLKDQIFIGIKHKINRFTLIFDSIFRNVHDQLIPIKQIKFQQKLNQYVEITLQQVHTLQNLNQHLSKVKKLEVIDNQYNTQNHVQYKNQLKTFILNQLNTLNSNVKHDSNLQQLQPIKFKLNTINIAIHQFDSKSQQFKPLNQMISSLQTKISNIQENCIEKKEFDPKYLQKLFDTQINKYYSSIESIKTSYKQLINSLEEAKQNKDYKTIMKILNKLRQYKQIASHLQKDWDTIEQNINNISHYVRRKQHILGNEFSGYLGNSKQLIDKDCLNQMKQYFDVITHMELVFSSQRMDIEQNRQHMMQIQPNLQQQEQNNINQRDNKKNINNQDQSIIKQIRQLHQQIVNTLERIIPKIQANSRITVLFKKLQLLQEYSQFISILKHYKQNIIQQKQQRLRKYATQKFIQIVAQTQSYQQFKALWQNKIKALPQQLQQYWNSTQLQKIINMIFQLQQINSTQTTQMKTTLIQKTKSLIQQTKESARSLFVQQRFRQFNDSINKIKKSQTQFKCVNGLVSIKSQFNQIINQIDQNTLKPISNQVQTYFRYQTKQNSQQIANIIIRLKKWANIIPSLQFKVYFHIKTILNHAKNNRFINLLKNRLTEMKKSPDTEIAQISGQIQQQYSGELQLPCQIPKTVQISIQHTINEFKTIFNDSFQSIDQLSQQQLKRIYDIFQKQYKQCQETYILNSQSSQIDNNLKKIKDLVDDTLKQLKQANMKEISSKQFIPVLLAKIFVFYSLSKSGQAYYNAKNNQLDDQFSPIQYLIEPNPIQVLSILYFLAMYKKQNQLQKIGKNDNDIFFSLHKITNNFMQIKTGEGKSIILGILSLLLALLGNDIFCVCYSSHLSMRDFGDFQKIFQSFNVKNRITYGTFTEISEMIINEEGNIREMVLDKFFPNREKTKRKQVKRKKQRSILLVDQADIIVDKKVYGATYNICAAFKNENIIEIIDLIWKNRVLNELQIQALIKSNPNYLALSQQYQNCIDQIDNQFKQMIYDVKIDQQHQKKYIVQNNKIGYKQFDGISFNSYYGYETMFHYIHQCQMNKISSDIKSEKLGINITCGRYSYAQIFNQFYKIFGVSGTLQHLNQFQQSVFEKLSISKTLADSIYGNARIQKLPILVERSQELHFLTLAQQLMKAYQRKQPVLVFFKDNVQLENFHNSHHIRALKDKICKVTEEEPDRDSYIKKATNQQQITFFVSIFGRGTDFKVMSLKVKQLGVMVIVTFVSDQISQQIQIFGRTARKGQKGTVQMIVNHQAFGQKLKITYEQIQNARQSLTYPVSKLIDQRRKEYLAGQKIIREQRVKQAFTNHKYSIRKKTQILNNTIIRNDSFFFMSVQYFGRNTLFIFAIDGSGSMMGEPWEDQIKSLDGILKEVGKDRTNTATVLVFNEKCHQRPQLTHQNPNNINLFTLKCPKGYTNPNPTFLKAAQMGGNFSSKKNIYFFYISDGEAAHPSNGIQSLLRLRRQLQKNNLKLDYTSILIGNSQKGRQCMEEINKQMGGKSEYVKEALQLLPKMKQVLRR